MTIPFTPLVKRLKILDKNAQIVPLVPNTVQLRYLQSLEEQFERTGRGRALVLKARQMGISTITEAVIFSMAIMFDNWLGYVIGHEIPASAGQLATDRFAASICAFRSLTAEPAP
jgi:hypothetical protein